MTKEMYKMGIIYNRFIPDGNASPLIIPYSDRSKILTYLTYDNFVGGSSPWGSEWPLPMKRVVLTVSGNSNNWTRVTTDEAIRLPQYASNNLYEYTISDTSSVMTFNGGTLYIVCKYTTDGKNPRFYTYDSNNNRVYVFTCGREPGSNFNAWRKGAQYLQLDSKMHDYYNVYAVNYYYDATASTFDVFAMFNVFTLQWNQQSGLSYKPKKYWAKREEGNMDIKFLAIVEGKESNEAIIKNVHNIMKYFDINGGRYW